MKKALAAWRWSLGVTGRSLVFVLALAALSVLWGLGAYRWLWLSEASIFLLLLALIWGLALILVAVAVLTATVAGAGDAAITGSSRLGLGTLVRFSRTQFTRCLPMAIGSAVLALVVAALCSWVNAHALEVASFLTFRSERAVSPTTVGNIFWVIEAFVSIVICAFLLSFLIILLRAGWREAWGQGRRTLADCCWRASFLSSLLSLVLFGGLAYLLASWHPEVVPGFWDYSQLSLRMGGALLLLVAGWVFLVLTLAKLNLPPAEGAPAQTPHELDIRISPNARAGL